MSRKGNREGAGGACMVTMNIAGAGFKLAPTKNKKDIRKIKARYCRNQNGEDKFRVAGDW